MRARAERSHCGCSASSNYSCFSACAVRPCHPPANVQTTLNKWLEKGCGGLRMRAAQNSHLPAVKNFLTAWLAEWGGSAITSKRRADASLESQHDRHHRIHRL